MAEPNAEPVRDDGHCWHDSGHGLSDTWGTSWAVHCCWCGATGTRREQSVRRKNVDGHGPHHFAPVWEVTYSNVGPCPARIDGSSEQS